MLIVNMHDAKSRLSQLVEAVESGSQAEVIIARNGQPAARIVPIEPLDISKRIGGGIAFLGGFAAMSQDEFDEGNEDIVRLFTEGE